MTRFAAGAGVAVRARSTTAVEKPRTAPERRVGGKKYVDRI